MTVIKELGGDDEMKEKLHQNEINLTKIQNMEMKTSKMVGMKNSKSLKETQQKKAVKRENSG